MQSEGSPGLALCSSSSRPSWAGPGKKHRAPDSSLPAPMKVPQLQPYWVAGGPSEVLLLCRHCETNHGDLAAMQLPCALRAEVKSTGRGACGREPFHLQPPSHSHRALFSCSLFPDGQVSAVVLPLLWFGRALAWESGERGSIPDVAINLL